MERDRRLALVVGTFVLVAGAAMTGAILSLTAERGVFVTHYRLMNLRLALRGGLAHTVMSSCVFGVYGAVYGLVWLFARNLSFTAVPIVAVSTVVLVGVFVRPLVTRAESLVDKVCL